MIKKRSKKWRFLRYALSAIIPGYIFVVYFNRAPKRDVPVYPGVIVSPANGKIIHIEKIDTREVSFFKKGVENTLQINDIEPPYYVVVIEMNLRSVHVQRAPISGTVIYQEHMPGGHANALSSAQKSRLVNINEKNLVVFQNDDISVGVVQVAGKAARRIRSYVFLGVDVTKGDIYGRIILGSQVVVVIPASVQLGVCIGDIVTDGETVLGSYSPDESTLSLKKS